MASLPGRSTRKENLKDGQFNNTGRIAMPRGCSKVRKRLLRNLFNFIFVGTLTTPPKGSLCFKFQGSVLRKHKVLIFQKEKVFYTFVRYLLFGKWVPYTFVRYLRFGKNLPTFLFCKIIEILKCSLHWRRNPFSALPRFEGPAKGPIYIGWALKSKLNPGRISKGFLTLYRFFCPSSFFSFFCTPLILQIKGTRKTQEFIFLIR